MKKILFILLFVFPIFIIYNLYYLDREYFLCPIQYKGEMVIRNDRRGEGFFAAPRNGNRIHQGIDLFAEVGTPVLAARSGKVVAATQSKGMGKYVIIKHADNMVTVYGHLSSLFVKNNDFVRQGQIIGRVGKTGNANFHDIKPHLHFEIKINGNPEDPLKYLP
ncbi:MAG: M23 family metallopeptidase [Candidatus Omnitrophica bacterium]|nr:M23 family metallopeptidase [Candidatus Omnitrophota bacterium]